MPASRSVPSVSARMQATGTTVFGFTYLGIFFLAPSDLDRYFALTGHWWRWLGIAVVLASALAVVAVGVTRRIDRLEPVAVGCALAFLALIAAWFAGWDGHVGQVPANGFDHGIVFIPQIASCLLVLCGRLGFAVANLVVAGGLSLLVASIASGGVAWVDLAAGLWVLALAGIYLGICWAVMSAAHRFDEQRQEAAARAVALLRSNVRDAERRRIDAMVHDRLIALLTALRPGPLSVGFRQNISGVLDELANWSTEVEPGAERIRATEFLQRLRLSVDDLGSGVEVEAVVSAPPGTEFPAAAADTVIEAVGEAVRNFHRHAGPEASGAVLCGVGPDRISAVVVDDGVGFDPEAIPAHRIGVALGILERMRQLDGGTSRVVSAPGAGTRVELGWADPGADR
ncbi:sensor histidine kinase [Gordonia sp. LUNF6]|uniref:sensor histidine kinase n=1 Tax=Gordonia TaxID=2053 RepID=UPI0024165562|nr:ATP-binding protein [Gordonia sihwensis]WFN92092.1 ATP-binding protein [Gordonia sihwensis]